MNGLTDIGFLTRLARENRVSISVEITPDENGMITQRISIEPWRPYTPICPYERVVTGDDADG